MNEEKNSKKFLTINNYKKILNFLIFSIKLIQTNKSELFYIYESIIVNI